MSIESPRNLFYSDREKSLFESVNNELLSNVTQQQVYYYNVSSKNTKTNLYGESDVKIYQKPIKFWCLVEYAEPNTNYTLNQSERNYQIIVKMFRKYLIEANREMLEGDIIQWGNYLFEIVNVQESNIVAGFPNEKWDTVLTCISSRKNITDLLIEQ